MALRGNLLAADAAVKRALQVEAHDARAIALATDATIALRRGRSEEALSAAREASQLLRSHNLFDQLGFIRLAYVESLIACDALAEAREALREASAWLRGSAATIDDEALRHSFLTNIPEHARLAALAIEHV